MQMHFTLLDKASKNVTPPTVINRSIFLGDEAMVSFIMEVRGESGGMDLEVTDFFKVNSDGKIILARAFWDASCITPIS